MMYRTKVIPTPKKLEAGSGKKIYNGPVKFFTEDFKLDFVLDFFKRQSGIEALAGEGTPSECDVVASLSKDLPKQNYILESKQGSPVKIEAGDYTGFLYAVSTLIQLIFDGELCDVYVKDSPDFPLRGNDWTSFCEIGQQSYDYGDGIEKMKQRVCRKLDMMLLYKINFIIMDGFCWNPDKPNDYANVHRFFNDEARKRGIYLCYTGYTMSYSGYEIMNFYGKNYLNINEKGEGYECSGQHQTKPSKEREHGTCITNEALTDAKIEEIKNFVQKIHPGALYLHGTDSGFMYQGTWDERCDDCRKKYPNDDLTAQDGAAGAYAEFYGRLSEGISSVKDGEFDASRDTLLLHIGPGYMLEDEIDLRGYETFKYSEEFWNSVDKYMKKYDNTFLVHREIFFDEEDDTLFYERTKRENTKIGIIYFSGADKFYSDQLYQTTGLVNYLMLGADLLITANGDAFREPLQLTNAEYMWNSTESAFYNLEKKPYDRKSFWKLFDKMKEASFRPDGIYAKDGLLHQCCIKLYGENAGDKMYELYSMCGENYECALLYPSNQEIRTSYRERTLCYRTAWETLLEQGEAEAFLRKFQQIKMLTDKADEIINSITECKESAKDDIEFFKKSICYSKKLMKIFVEYMDVYRILNKSFEDGTDFDREKIEKYFESIEKGTADLEKYINAQKLKPVDILGGSVAKWHEVPKHFTYNISTMKNSIKTGERKPSNTVDFCYHYDRKSILTKNS